MPIVLEFRDVSSGSPSRHVQAGHTEAPEIANLAISFVFIALSLTGFVWQFGRHRLEDNFDCHPWAKLDQDKIGQLCPFTGEAQLSLSLIRYRWPGCSDFNCIWV